MVYSLHTYLQSTHILTTKVAAVSIGLRRVLCRAHKQPTVLPHTRDVRTFMRVPKAPSESTVTSLLSVRGTTNMPTYHSNNSPLAWTRLSICLLFMCSPDALHVSGNRSRSGTDLWRGGTPRTTVDEGEAPDLRPSVGHLSRHNAAVATVSGRGELARCAFVLLWLLNLFGLYCTP